jgi:hypothetical protein
MGREGTFEALPSEVKSDVLAETVAYYARPFDIWMSC